MVTICTTSLTFNNSTFCPYTVIMCSVWISEQTATCATYSTNWLVFIIETECVYCAVRTGSLYIIQDNFCVQLFPVYLTRITSGTASEYHVMTTASKKIPRRVDGLSLKMKAILRNIGNYLANATAGWIHCCPFNSRHIALGTCVTYVMWCSAFMACVNNSGYQIKIMSIIFTS